MNKGCLNRISRPFCRLFEYFFGSRNGGFVTRNDAYVRYVINGDWLEVSNSFGSKSFPISKIKEIVCSSNNDRLSVNNMSGHIDILFTDSRPMVVLSVNQDEILISKLKAINPDILIR